MTVLTESQIERLLDRAQHSVLTHEHYYQDRDPQYREILDLVGDLADLLLEVRRDRTALHAVVRAWDEYQQRLADDPGADVREYALRMSSAARHALGLPPHTVTTVELRALVVAEL